MSALGHKQPVGIISGEWPVSEVRQPFPRSGIDGTLSIDSNRLLFSIADEMD
jgi:hypothetical protein